MECGVQPDRGKEREEVMVKFNPAEALSLASILTQAGNLLDQLLICVLSLLG